MNQTLPGKTTDFEAKLQRIHSLGVTAGMTEESSTVIAAKRDADELIAETLSEVQMLRAALDFYAWGGGDGDLGNYQERVGEDGGELADRALGYDKRRRPRSLQRELTAYRDHHFGGVE